MILLRRAAGWTRAYTDDCRVAVARVGGEGDWPAGQLSHLVGLGEDGRAFVVETRTSREAQAEFLQNRLGPAMAQAGLTATPKVTCANVIGEHRPGE
jgi:hypothetical protein